MKRQALMMLLMVLAVLAWGAPLTAQQQSTAPAPQSFLSPSAAFIGRAVQIPMRDGQTLAADVYLPRGGGKHPVVLIQTPYNKDPMRPGGRVKGAGARIRSSLMRTTLSSSWTGAASSLRGARSSRQTAEHRRGRFRRHRVDRQARVVEMARWPPGGCQRWGEFSMKRPARIRRIWFAPCPSSCRSIWITTLTFPAACCGKSSR